MVEHSPQVASGVRPPPPVPANADPIGVFQHYMCWAEKEFTRARHVVKRRSGHVVLISATATALIAVLGAATPITGWTWLGIATAALAGLVTVVERWDAHFRHRDLWIQRTIILAQLQRLKRDVELSLATNQASDDIAKDAMARLNDILAEDVQSWGALRQNADHHRPTNPSSRP